MNLQSIKEEFKTYYLDKLQNQGQDTSSLDSEKQSVSIFAHKDEFKDFLKTKYNADSDVLSKGLSEILKMDVVDGELVEDENKEGPGSQDFMNQLINEALNDEQVRAALDIDGSEELDSEEIGIFLKNIQNSDNSKEAEEETTNEDSENLTFDDIAKGVESIYNGEYQNYDVNLDDESLKGDEAVESLLGELFLNKKTFSELDSDKDGILSLEEQNKFKEYIENYDGFNDEISLSDVKSAYFDILDGKFSYDNKLDFDNTKQEVVDPIQDKKTYQAAAPTNSVSAPRSSYGASRASSSANVQAKTVDNMNLVELESQKTQKTQEVQEAQQNINKIHSGENEAVKNAQNDVDKAKEDYDKALNAEIESNPELKQLFLPLKDTIAQIDSTQKAINDVQIQIADMNNELTSQTSTLSADESNLAALESSKSSLLAKKDSGDEKLRAKIDEKLSSLENQIKAAKDKVEADKKAIDELKEKLEKLETGEGGLKELQENLEKLEQTKTQQEENIENIISDTTKQAKEAYDNAQKNLASIKEAELEKAQQILTTKQDELNKINELINEKQALKTQSENGVSVYDFNFETNLTAQQASDLEKFKSLYENNQEKYQKVEDATGVPAQLIAAIHWRESTGNFNTYLHNGDPLGKPTVHVPEGIYFEDWSEAAIHAISSHNPEIVQEGDVNSLYEFAEQYNGNGYKKRGINTPYVWAGTTNYQSGKFVADHVFDSSAVDKQLGVAVMLQAICD